MDKRVNLRASTHCLIAAALCTSTSAFSAEPGWPEPIEDNVPFGMIIADQLEYRDNDGANTLRWDMQGWYGTDTNKLWMKLEGDDQTSANAGEFEVQALYSRMIAPFWDLQFGLRHDQVYGPGPNQDRSFAVLGVQGLAPYRFEVEPALFISDDGDVSARLVGTYELLFSQRLILQPRLETNIAASSVPAFGVGTGLNDVQIGLRLRYEFRREFAPYVGVSWKRQFGNTADMTRAEGGDVDNLAIVAGVRFWF
ncbi:copper resistance protein B [uncultured Porticoccus sp.]|uniref:copper resistance protein B n=1 Tax=uncultured Porticoccus sp. TaxID=1256050 RepID=UPI0030DCAE00